MDQIGKYKIVRKIGRGAMGEVYEAQDPVLKRSVAIKTITASLGSDEQFRKRFQREAQSAAQLNHPNIVTVFDFGQEQDKLFMAMELLAGTDLKDLISRRVLHRLDDKLAIIEQMLSGLAFAHAKGVIHRDLKPANIHVLPNKTVKILDFGLARLGVSEMTRTGTVMGTPNYMSPEQVRAEDVDGRSDLFSVGAVLYELLSGRKPFDAESMHAILFEVLERDPHPLPGVAPEVPPLLLPIVDKALAKQPERRYQSAIEMRDAIRAARRAMASAQAAAAALAGPEDPEATMVQADIPTIFGGSLPPSAPSIPSAAYRPPSMVAGATALDLAASRGDASLSRTARPDPTLSEASSYVTPPEPPASRRALIAVTLAVGLVAVAAGMFWMLRQRTPSMSPEELARQQQTMIREQLIATKVDLARTELQNKQWDQAVSQADEILGIDAANAEAQEIKTKAQQTLATLETAARDAKTAFDKGDTAAASKALERVLAIDSHHPVVAELTASLNQYFTTQAEQAQKTATIARASAEKTKAASSEAFRAADRVAKDGQGLLANQHYAEATQKFIEAADGFDRARRTAEVAAIPQTPAPSARPTSIVERFLSPAPSYLSPAPAPVSPSSSPSALTVIQSPPISPPLIAPSASLPPSLPPVTTAPASAGTAAEPAVRRVIADYGRAIESRDLNLYKSLRMLSADQERSVKDSFKQKPFDRVVMNIDSVQIDGPRAVVRVTPQYTMEGKALPPKPQTFRLAQKDGNWIIESMQ
jgi:eukaryotic-like serine/threonine-protein kinase